MRPLIRLLVAALSLVLRVDLNWNSSQVDFVYSITTAKRGSLIAKTLFKRLLRNSPFLALRGLPLLLRRWQHDLRKRA